MCYEKSSRSYKNTSKEKGRLHFWAAYFQPCLPLTNGCQVTFCFYLGPIRQINLSHISPSWSVIHRTIFLTLSAALCRVDNEIYEQPASTFSKWVQKYGFLTENSNQSTQKKIQFAFEGYETRLTFRGHNQFLL